MTQSADSHPRQSRTSILGNLGERLVAQWLQQQGWIILAQGWHSRWGELDIVASHIGDRPGLHQKIAFVEVKTRSSGNWDENGLLAITSSKQSKLWKTAQLYLSEYPALAELTCRFDVALVVGQKLAGRSNIQLSSALPIIALGQPVLLDGYRLSLETYLESAFEQK
jgi:putative endonuclease